MSRLLTRSAAALLLAWACCGRMLATEPDAFSKIVSFQYESSLEEVGTTIQSKVVSFQYFDKLDDADLTFATSASASFFFPDGQSLYTSGTVKTPSSVLVAGANVTLKRQGTLFWQGTTGLFGDFITPGLGVANYSVTVTKPGYQSLFQNVIGTGSGRQSLNLKLVPLPPAPTAITTTRTTTLAEIARPEPTNPANLPKLVIFNGSAFVQVEATGSNSIQPNRMTVVMSHGMNSSPTEWATTLALLIRQNHSLGEPKAENAPNIVAWDWSFLATGYGPGHMIPPIDEAVKQGKRLGDDLLRRLSSGYSQRLHFVGHSLGTIVNRYACDYMHGTMPRGSSNAVSHCNQQLTRPHLTLLDDAAVASVFGTNVIASATLGAITAGGVGAIKAGVVAASLDWKSPVPSSAYWMDSYVSMFGILRPETVNVCLGAGVLSFNITQPFAAHGYAHVFYRSTAQTSFFGSSPNMGYPWSYEKGLLMPPSGVGLAPGSLWHDNLETSDPLDLYQEPSPNLGRTQSEFVSLALLTAGASTVDTATRPLQNGGQALLNGYSAGIQWAGDQGGAVIYKTQQVGVSVKQKIGNFWDAVSDKASDALNSIDPDTQLAGSFIQPSFSMSFSNQTAPAPAPFAMKGVSVQNAPADAGAGGEASAWITVTVPADAGMMAFDFKVTGEPVDDEVVCAINGQNIFALPAMFTPDGVTVSTDMMDVSAYAGQQIEIFFGLAGGTSTNCVLEVDGIRFITVPMPKLALEDHGANVQLQWPVAASGWVLETSENLAPGSWLPVTGLNQAVAAEGVASLMQAKASTTRFFRLRRTP